MSNDPSIVKLVGVIVSYPKLFTPEKIANGEDLKFSCRLILPKGFDMTTIKAAIANGVQQKSLTGSKAKNHTVKKVDDEGHKYNGFLALSTTNYEETPPQVVRPNLKPLTDHSAIFGGCVVDAIVRFAGYTTGKGGIRCEAKVIVLRDNDVEPLVEGGRVNAEDYFTAVEGAPPQNERMGAPSTQQQPADDSLADMFADDDIAF